jgi:putative transposase
VAIRCPTWDLSQIHLVDERTDRVLCRLYPLDKERNASGLRRPLESLKTNPELARVPPAKGLPPLLVQILAQ